MSSCFSRVWGLKLAVVLIVIKGKSSHKGVQVRGGNFNHSVFVSRRYSSFLRVGN